MSDSDTEIVLMVESGNMEVDLLVSSVETALREFMKAGGKVVSGPFDIQMGRCAVVRDPWENVLAILDTSKGLLKVDASGNVSSSSEWSNSCSRSTVSLAMPLLER